MRHRRPDPFYGGVEDLQEKMDAGKGISAYNREQQGDIASDYYILREELEEYYALPLVDRPAQLAPDQLAVKLAELNVYIHFVRDVSSLDTDQLDVDDPLATGGSNGSPATNTGDSRRGSNLAGGLMLDRPGDRDDRDLARDAAFAELATPTAKSPTLNLVAVPVGRSCGSNAAPQSPAPTATRAGTSGSNNEVKSQSLVNAPTKPLSTRALDQLFEALA
jgi:hypothetical protein